MTTQFASTPNITEPVSLQNTDEIYLKPMVISYPKFLARLIQELTTLTQTLIMRRAQSQYQVIVRLLRIGVVDVI